MPSPFRKLFSLNRSWVMASALRIGTHRAARGEESCGGRRHILEFIGDDRDGFEEVRRAPLRRHNRRSVWAAATSKAGPVAGAKTWVRRPSRAAASASMRPSWPAPRMPIVPPGAIFTSAAMAVQPAWPATGSPGSSATAAVWAARQASSRSASGRSCNARTAAASSAALMAPALADGQRADRHAGRHLHDREQRITAGQRLRFDRHAEHRQLGQRRRHAGQMGGAAGAGDDQLEARGACALGEGEQPLRSAMGGDDPRL